MADDETQTSRADDAAVSRESSAPRISGWNRNGLWLVGLAPLVPQAVGSVFNISYNVIHVHPLLKADQAELLHKAILFTNLFVYPFGLMIWIAIVASVRKPFSAMLRGETIAPPAHERACRRAVNFPLWALPICGGAWLACIPAILIPLQMSTEPVDVRVIAHMTTSIFIGGLIGVTHAFFAVEMASQRFVLPVLFRETRPSSISGTFALSLQQRGLMWAVSAVVCPVVCLWLLIAAPDSVSKVSSWFAGFTAIFAIGLGLWTAWMLGRLVARPVAALRDAAREVAGGNLDTNIDMVRADEFGPLIDEFNSMVGELREKQRLQTEFGRHVGKEAARQILAQDPNLAGLTQEITVMFADLRNFTARCSGLSAQHVVKMLNLFFTEMVEVIEERRGGMVNKFLGDGLMAFFGAGTPQPDHAQQALTAATEMLERLESLNHRLVELGYDPLQMGIGIHTGPAVVGSIGSTGRGDFTAIGNTVNIASRVEGLTKSVGTPILITEDTLGSLKDKPQLISFPPQQVKGKEEPLVVYGIIRPPVS